VDSFGGRTYVSLVGFRFCETKLWGKVAVPFHSEFEEANLRFYVRRESDDELRRGVVFIKEIVPKPAIALTARLIYGENYVSLPMNHKISISEAGIDAEYSWKHNGKWSRIHARASGAGKTPVEGSLEQYITEHYWGYSRQKSGRTIEYRVTHIRGVSGTLPRHNLKANAAGLYGADFAAVLSRPPDPHKSPPALQSKCSLGQQSDALRIFPLKLSIEFGILLQLELRLANTPRSFVPDSKSELSCFQQLCALLCHSFAVACNLTRLFPIASALFSKNNRGVGRDRTSSSPRTCLSYNKHSVRLRPHNHSTGSKTNTAFSSDRNWPGPCSFLARRQGAVMRRQKLDWKHEIDKKELRYGVLMLLLYLAAIMIATAGARGPRL